MEVAQIIQEIVSIVKRRAPEETQVVLFGSWANGTAQKTSDVDIGLLGKEPLPSLTMTQIINEVSALPTLRKIDIVDLNTVDARFKESALKNHKMLTPTP
jgi:predicted nucleotidyltransferase